MPERRIITPSLKQPIPEKFREKLNKFDPSAFNKMPTKPEIPNPIKLNLEIDHDHPAARVAITALKAAGWKPLAEGGEVTGISLQHRSAFNVFPKVFASRVKGYDHTHVVHVQVAGDSVGRYVGVRKTPEGYSYVRPESLKSVAQRAKSINRFRAIFNKKL